jgi:hypothetical protein
MESVLRLVVGIEQPTYITTVPKSMVTFVTLLGGSAASISPMDQAADRRARRPIIRSSALAACVPEVPRPTQFRTVGWHVVTAGQ